MPDFSPLPCSFLSMWREKKLIRTRSQACNRKCYILGVTVPKNNNYSTQNYPLLSSVSKPQCVRTVELML
jgi:hypothetical protein